jgi:hypothetical protein
MTQLATIFLQPFIVSSNFDLIDAIDETDCAPAVDGDLPQIKILSSSTGALTVPSGSFVKTIFTSVPVLWESEIAQDYRSLGESLSEMTALDTDEELRIEPTVYRAAQFVASALLEGRYPAPRVFNHGPGSVVFNWSSNTDNLYLTISEDGLSALVASPQRIERRLELDYSSSPALSAQSALAFVQTASPKQPRLQFLTGAVSEPLEIGN